MGHGPQRGVVRDSSGTRRRLGRMVTADSIAGRRDSGMGRWQQRGVGAGLESVRGVAVVGWSRLTQSPAIGGTVEWVAGSNGELVRDSGRYAASPWPRGGSVRNWVGHRPLDGQSGKSRAATRSWYGPEPARGVALVGWSVGR